MSVCVCGVWCVFCVFVCIGYVSVGVLVCMVVVGMSECEGCVCVVGVCLCV